GELKTAELITKATNLAIQGAADFVKTSTAKVAINATLDATNVMLSAIKQSGKVVGVKAAGAVKTVNDAKEDLALTRSIKGDDDLQAATNSNGA
ncbi:deoxyribose-phosphate aldolase, partial [Pseudoalteromonas sp. S326]